MCCRRIAYIVAKIEALEKRLDAVLARVTADEGLGVYGAIDCGAFVSSSSSRAESLGIATIAQAALASQAGFLCISGGTSRVVRGISFGYEDAAHPANRFRTGRADTDEITEMRRS
jgi:hypothetical protein